METNAVLSAVQQLVGRAQALKGEVTGNFVLGTISEYDVMRVEPLLAGFVQAVSLLDIRTRSGLADELYEQVTADLLHAAFFVGASLPHDVKGVSLRQLHYRVVGPTAWKYRLLHADWAALAAMPWVVPPARHHVRRLLGDVFAQRGLQPSIAVECEEYSFSQGLVRNGVGLALLREERALQASEKEELLVWPHARLQAQLSLMYPDVREHDPATVAMLSVLRRVWNMEITRNER